MSRDLNPILVVGGGIAGITAAVEAAEVGYPVVLVEKEASIGGRVLRTHRYFPKMCPPACGFEVNARRIRNNPNITVQTLTTLEEISGEAGNFRVRLRKRPRYVTGQDSLEAMAAQLESERVDEFNMGMGTTKALYLPHHMAFPPIYTLDREALSESDVRLLEIREKRRGLDLEMPEEVIELKVGAVVLATGWRPYDATKLEHLGFGRCKNVLTNVMLERVAASDGPTEGEIVRPSDGKKAENVAFVQCAGSRDENHLPYCSAVCCMASLKQARYVREKNENSRVTIFYIDMRTVGRLEKFCYDMLADGQIEFVKGKVAGVSEDPDTGNLILEVEDTMQGKKPERSFDLVVLATGVVPNRFQAQMPFELNYDEYGFLETVTGVDGIYAAGCTKRPCDVSRSTRDATGAALKAIQCLSRERGSHGG